MARSPFARAKAGKLIDNDLGYRRIMRDMFKGWRKGVVAGIQGKEATEIHNGSDLTNIELALIHEYGTRDKKIPERSFMRSTLTKNRNTYFQALANLLKSVVDGRLTQSQALGQMGEKIVSDIKNTIEIGIPPPNAETTIRQKGSSTPLINTSQLKNSITWALVSKANLQQDTLVRDA